MYHAWTKHCKDTEEKEKFKSSVLAAKPVLEQLMSIMTAFEKGLDRDEISKEHYEKPSWAFRQAHNNGYRHCLQTLFTLLDLDKQVIKEKE